MILKLLNNHNFRQFFKFCIVGGTAAVINFVIYYVCTEYLKFWYVYSAVIAYLLSAVFNFIANKIWTFRNKESGREILKQVAKFSIVISAGLTINTSIIYILTEFGKLDYRISWVCATGLVIFWNYGFNRLWTFRVKKVEVADEVSSEL